MGESIKAVSGIYSREEVKILLILKLVFRRGNLKIINLAFIKSFLFLVGEGRILKE